MRSGKRQIDQGDIVINCSAWRRPFEFALRRRGAYGIGKYGLIIAVRWLESLGTKPDRWHTFGKRNGGYMRPDLFDHSTRVAYEVKTGQFGLSRESKSQIKGYRHALDSRQAQMIVYLNVAFNGRVGLSEPFRDELSKQGFRLIILV